MRIRGQTQCCSLNNFWCPVELLIQYLISFSRGVLLASSFDHAWITPSFRARVNRARDFQDRPRLFSNKRQTSTRESISFSSHHASSFHQNNLTPTLDVVFIPIP